MRRHARLALLLSLSLCVTAQAQLATRLRDGIAAIAAGSDTAARRQVIVQALAGSGIEYQLEEFTFPAFSGTNIVADLPGRNTTRTLLVGAHYDRVAQGNGAVDNASSCAVLLELLAAFKANPLQNYAVKGVFFDMEERGLVGSQAYFARAREGGTPALAVNLDIFGYGDTLFAVSPSPAAGPLITALQQAAKDSSMPVRLIETVSQYPASDHRIMITAGIDTLGLALIDGAEIDAILQPRANPAPRIMSIIHSSQDTIDSVRGDDVEKALPVLERMLRLVDEATNPIH
jgi:putative aminopeptidase FrvX